jgi:hypothetical protein
MGVRVTNPGGPGAVLAAVGAVLPADVGLGLAATTIVQTSSVLPVGTYVVNFGVTVANGNAAVGTVEAVMSVNSATATFVGQESAEAEFQAIAASTVSIDITCIVVVTVAGTLNFSVKAPGASANTAKATTPTSAFAGATGWSALRVA